MDAERAGRQHAIIGHAVKIQRLTFGRDARKGDVISRLHQPLQQQTADRLHPADA
jgi:hypothetical protein